MGFLTSSEPKEDVYQQPSLDSQYSSVYSPQSQGMISADVLHIRLDTVGIVEEIEHDLKGEVFNKKTNQWEARYGRWVNDDGLMVIKSIVAGYTNKMHFLGNFTQGQINYKCNNLKKELSKLICSKYECYGIDKQKRSLLVRYILDKVHSSLSRSEGALESRQISQSSSQQHIVHEQKNYNKGGLFDSVIGKFKS